MSTRNKLRSALLGANVVFKSKLVEVNGESYEVREPSKGAFTALLEKCKSGDGYSANLSTMLAIECTYIPGTDERVFDEDDIAVLNTLPISSPFTKLLSAADELLKTDESFEKK